MSDDVKPETEAKVGDPAVLYNPSTRLPAKRELKVERPGNVNYAAPGGSYPGSRVVTFHAARAEGLEDEDAKRFLAQLQEEPPASAADALNLYFKHRANLLTVAVMTGHDGSLTVIFTNHLEGERLEWFHRYQQEVARTMEKWEAEQEKKREEAEAKAKAKAEEEATLLALGKKARDHNLIERLRELDEENKKLRKQLTLIEKGVR